MAKFLSTTVYRINPKQSKSELKLVQVFSSARAQQRSEQIDCKVWYWTSGLFMARGCKWIGKIISTDRFPRKARMSRVLFKKAPAVIDIYTCYAIRYPALLIKMKTK